MFIVIEGIDGSGKTTLASHLADDLMAAGFSVILTREPGGSWLGEQVRPLILQNPVQPLTELLLFAAARTELVHTIIRPALINPLNCVICDRFTASTVAYQGYGRGLELSLIHKLNQSATGGLKPDWTILLDLDVKTSIDRRRKAGDVNRFDTEKVAFLDRVRDGYLMQVIQNEDRYFVLDAMRSLADLRQDIFSFVSAKLRENSEGRR